ncbi:MAG: hypothetical protein ACE5Q3_09585 [Alphaproteobacteria bacterium]
MTSFVSEALLLAAGFAAWILRHVDLLDGWPGLLILGFLLFGMFMFRRGV